VHQALDQRRALAYQEILNAAATGAGAWLRLCTRYHSTGRKALHLEHHQVAGQQIQTDGVGGEECDTHAGDHRLLDGSVLWISIAMLKAGELAPEHFAH